MSIGRHSEESIIIEKFQETIRLNEKEILDIKKSVADIFLEIININESNDYNAPEIRKRKISEICRNTRNELLMDEEEEKEKRVKFINLPKFKN